MTAPAAGVHAADNLVFGQRAIFALGPELRSRLNGLYLAIFFAGGAASSALSGWCYARYGWAGVSVLGAVLPSLSLLYLATERHDRRVQAGRDRKPSGAMGHP